MKALLYGAVWLAVSWPTLRAAETLSPTLRAGTAKVDITHPAAPTRDDPLYVKALALDDGVNTAVLITLDVVAIAEIGPIRSDYLARVRTQLEKELQIPSANVLVNVSHCHGQVCADVVERTVQAVRAARRSMTPVRVGAGSGTETRISENRRLKLRSGAEADVRHAYALPPDEQVTGMGPIDPEIGLLRLDRLDGQTLAVVYNFACHPILGIPGGGNTADLTGAACRVIEDNLSPGAVALFVQGCAGDVNPVLYKDVGNPRDAELPGSLLGLSVLRAVRRIECREAGPLRIINETLGLPRADNTRRIAALQAEQARLLRSLKGTSLNLKTFLPLAVKYNASAEFPSYYSHGYLHDQAIGRDDRAKLDVENRKNLEQYVRNIHTMEELTRVQANLSLLEKHQAQNLAAASRTLAVEVVGLRVGPFALITFPGELSVQIGLNIKKQSPRPHTFVAGYTNGYIYYAPTKEQLLNRGCAQEDCDCLLAPEWQALFENKAADILKRL